MQAETQSVEILGPEGARSSKIVLRGSVDVTVSSQLLDAARQAAVAGRDTIVDGSEITRLDLSSVQILLSLREAMKGGALRIGAMSPAARRFLEIAGVAPLFPIEPEASIEEASAPAPAEEPAATAAGGGDGAEAITQEYDESAWELVAAQDAAKAGDPGAAAAPAEGALGSAEGGLGMQETQGTQG